MPRVIVTAPLTRMTRRIVVDSAGAPGAAPARILRETTELDAPALDIASAAKDAGADVAFFGLCEAGVENPLRARFEAIGVDCVLRVASKAAAGTTIFEQADGSVRFVVQESRPPAPADQDRLLDDLASELLQSPAFVVVAGDLDGVKRADFGERVVGRAWGIGVKSFVATDLAALKQTFHTYPYGLLVRRENLASVCVMPRSPADETEDQTLERAFSESMRVIAIRTGPQVCVLAAHGARIECATAASDARIAGTIAALAAASPDEPIDVVRRASARLNRGE